MVYDYALLRAYELGAEAMLTIGPLIAMVKTENQVIFQSAALAKQLRMSKATIDRHIARARKIGLIEPDPLEANITRGIRIWRLCPFLAWKGSAESQRTYIKQLPPDHIFFSFQQPNEDSSHE